jgi:FkbH-like protein
MYETEANRQKQSREQIPADVLACFSELNGMVAHRTVLPWSEHCTECVWPSCYTTCDLYSAREDGRCRRFVDGMVRIDCPNALNDYVLKITFKRWAKLWAPGNIRLRPFGSALRAEHRDYRIGLTLTSPVLPRSIRTLATGKRYSLKKKLAYRRHTDASLPSSFMLECYNPGDDAVSLSFTIRSLGEMVTIPFQKLIELTPGFHRLRIPYAEIEAIVDLHHPFNVEIIPNGEVNGVTLVFGLMDFVQELPRPAKNEKSGVGDKKPKIKCVVWDLDNTMWNGILVEDEADTLTLKPGIRETLLALDERGILLSIASKNNHDEAWAVLKQMGLDELFLAPQISWGPKSESIREIAHRLNIGLDSLLFVDDSIFELQEVSSALHEVRVLDAWKFEEILELDECKVPATAESRNRRKMYQVEAERQNRASGFAGDYMAFLRDCEIRINILSLTGENLDRVHELTQRTNQMNFSGNRYDHGKLRQVLATPWLDTYVLEVEDRFGSYGTVGFSIVDSREPLMTDLMFSCRIQSKRVEHAFLTWLIQKYRGAPGKDVWASYRRTEKNAPSGKVFADIGMEEVDVVDGVSRLVFRKDAVVPDDGVITINAQTAAAIA